MKLRPLLNDLASALLRDTPAFGGNDPVANESTDVNTERPEMPHLPGRYLSKPVEVQAMQWNPGDLAQAGILIGWLLSHDVPFHHPSGTGGSTTLQLVGDLSPIDPGGWVYRRSEGQLHRFYTLSDQEFHDRYQAAPYDPRAGREPLVTDIARMPAAAMPPGTVVFHDDDVLRRRPHATRGLPWKSSLTGARSAHGEVDHAISLGATVGFCAACAVGQRCVEHDQVGTK